MLTGLCSSKIIVHDMGAGINWRKILACFKIGKPLADNLHFQKNSSKEYHGHAIGLLEHSSDSQEQRVVYSTEQSTVVGSEDGFLVDSARAVASMLDTSAPIVCTSTESLDFCAHDNTVEEMLAAALRIQSAFRGFLARRACRALRGLVILQALARGHAVRKRAARSTAYLQPLLKMEAHVHEAQRRAKKPKNGEGVPQMSQQLNHPEASSESKRGWCSSRWTAEATLAKVRERQDAAIRRERAMAYAFWNQQWKSSVSIKNGPQKAQSSSSWLERWMAAQPWENRGKELRLKNEWESQSESKNDKSSGRWTTDSKRSGEDQGSRRLYSQISSVISSPAPLSRSHLRSNSNLSMGCTCGFNEGSTDSCYTRLAKFNEDVACLSFRRKTGAKLKSSIPNEHIMKPSSWAAAANLAQARKHPLTNKNTSDHAHNYISLDSRFKAQQKLEIKCKPRRYHKI